MNALSASPAESSMHTGGKARALVWDAPVRVFHWLMVFSFAGASLTADSERWRLLHVTLGYTMAGLVGFRLVWGFVGTRYARFAHFVRGPAAAVRYLASLLRGTPEPHVGHNPAGAWAIVALLLLTLGVCATGWIVYNDPGGDWLEDAHEAVATLMLAVVAVHVSGVVVGSRLHRENLVASMVTGRKAVPTGQGIRRAWRPLAALLLAAVLGFWVLQWQTAPAGASADERAGAVPTTRHADHDDD
jgi:cytochrome b